MHKFILFTTFIVIPNIYCAADAPNSTKERAAKRQRATLSQATEAVFELSALEDPLIDVFDDMRSLTTIANEHRMLEAYAAKHRETCGKGSNPKKSLAEVTREIMERADELQDIPWGHHPADFKTLGEIAAEHRTQSAYARAHCPKCNPESNE